MDEPAAATLTAPGLVEAPVEGWWRRFVRTFVTDVRASANARAVVSKDTDRKMVIVFVVAAIALTCGNFLSDGTNPSWLESSLRAAGLPSLARRLHDAMLVSSHRDFNQLAYWAIVVIFFYVVPATLCIKLVFRERVRDYGLHFQGSHARNYIPLYLIAAPLIIAFSFTAAFQEKYPFYHPPAAHSLWPYMYAWWALYWLQFVALEFFFRGFLVHGLAPRLGWAAIFAMVLPYNMLHYGKPMAEALAAIVGGVVLGTLSLKTRSIWWGAALHISIALTMDVCALWHLGRVF